jgi:hypothetical protein
MSGHEPDEPGVSIDDLLGYAAEELLPEPPRRRFRWGTWVAHGVFVAAFSAVILTGLRIAGLSVAPMLVVAGVATLRALQMLAGRVAAPPAPRLANPPVAGTGDGRYDWQSGDALRSAVRQWENRLESAHADGAKFSRKVLPVLAELADERLRQRHGLTRASDPRRARELLGEPLWRTLHEPGRRLPKAREVAAYVTVLENL